MTHDLRSFAVLMALVIAALVVACGGGEDNTSEPLAVSCANIKALHSYRYTINVKLKTASEIATPTTSPQAPAGGFTDDLNALLSDFTLNGAYIAPDRTTTIIRA